MKENIDINIVIFDGRTAHEMLRAARTTGRRKREIQTIARQLCIREEFLEALESGEYNKIPEVVYILGFARNYAIELELDPAIIVGKIKYELGIIKNPADEESDEEHAPECHVVCAVPRESVIKRTRDFATKNWKILAAAAGAVIVALLLIFTIIAIVGTLRNVEYVPTEIATTAGTNEPAFNIPVRETFGNANRATANVVLQATAETWLRIEDSRGETLFSRVMMVGDVYFVPTANVRATVGNAGGLDVWVNNVQAPALGPLNARRSNIVMTPTALMPE